MQFVEKGRPVLDWATRLKVAAGASRGIAYLHEDCKSLLFVFCLAYLYISLPISILLLTFSFFDV